MGGKLEEELLNAQGEIRTLQEKLVESTLLRAALAEEQERRTQLEQTCNSLKEELTKVEGELHSKDTLGNLLVAAEKEHSLQIALSDEQKRCEKLEQALAAAKDGQSVILREMEDRLRDMTSSRDVLSDKMAKAESELRSKDELEARL